ncbi:conserved hypothetical protein [delta proteobacterium NaphS2]|nr:conserved hypothetical protein [delta proteobacterium NaphS2]
MVRRGSEMPFLRLMGCYCERFSPPRLRQSSTNCSGGVHMMVKKPLFPKRIRKIAGGFAFIEHRFEVNPMSRPIFEKFKLPKYS